MDNNDIILFNRGYILEQKLSASYQGQFINTTKVRREKCLSLSTLFPVFGRIGAQIETDK